MAKTDKKAVAKKQPKLVLSGFATWNKVLAAVYALQAIAIVVASKGSVVPVSVSYSGSDSLASQAVGQTVLAPASKHLFDVNMVHLIAVILLIAAIMHVAAATKLRERFEQDLGQNRNIFRWGESTVSVGLMIVVLGLVSGVQDIASLVMLFSISAIFHLVGLKMELFPISKRIEHRLAYLIGLGAGVITWLVLGIYVLAARLNGQLPGYVYLLDFIMLVLFSASIVLVYLQMARKGRWADYPYSERVFMVLGLISKSVLAWLLFVGLLHP